MRKWCNCCAILTEKGAFWSGINREEQFGGETRNLYDVLYTEFAKNPFFLGTIAYSEGITKVNLKVKIYERRDESFRPNGKKDTFRRSYVIDRDESGNKLEGILATVDLGNSKIPTYAHHFFKNGTDHDSLIDALRGIEAFFPGGVVGRHAFYTLLENTLRDIKHFGYEERARMKKEGLTLAVSIFPSKLSKSLRKGIHDYSLYKIGIWIEASQSLCDEHKSYLGNNSLKNIVKGILTSTQQARLGGSQQDKVCASMLMTGKFTDVDEKESKVGKPYFPWIRFAHYYPTPELSTNGLEGEDEYEYEFRLKENGELFNEGELDILPTEEGYLKKYFHLWRGEFVYDLKQKDSLLNLNMGRYQVVNVDGKDDAETGKKFSYARKKGAIRVIRDCSQSADKPHVYFHWLRTWLGKERKVIRLRVGGGDVGYVIMDKEAYHYYNFEAYRSKFDGRRHANYLHHEISFEHGGEEWEYNKNFRLRLRNHGILKTKFFPDVESIDDLDNGQIANELRTYELAETILTKVCIFDDRMAQRIVHKEQHEHLINQLNLDIQPETPEAWAEAKQDGLLNQNIVVFHIAFIKQLMDKKGVPYTEGKIVDFVRNEIVEDLKIPDNFIFVITSGRGRQQWRNQLQKVEKLWDFITFRPSESLINAIEDGAQLNDDFQIKYNVLKVLLGS